MIINIYLNKENHSK